MKGTIMMHWTKTTDSKGQRVFNLMDGPTLRGTVTAVHTTGTGVTHKVLPTVGDAVWVDKAGPAKQALIDLVAAQKAQNDD